MDDYDRGGHTKYSLTVHMIFVTKYRKQLFFGKANEDVKQFLYNTADTIGVRIITMETDKDHVHILLRYKPDMNISRIASQLKQRSTYNMWIYHTYFACSIGQVSQKTIEHYIQNQG